MQLLIYKLQISKIKEEANYQVLKQKLKEISSLLIEKENIPMVSREISLLKEIQKTEWWDSVNTLKLEDVRRSQLIHSLVLTTNLVNPRMILYSNLNQSLNLRRR